MAGYRPTYRTYGGDQKLEIVKGKEFSANQIYVYRSRSPDPPQFPSRNSRPTKISLSSSSSTKTWSFNSTDMKRRKRVAKYKFYTIEGKVKSSFRRGIRWIKKKCSNIVHGV